MMRYCNVLRLYSNIREQGDYFLDHRQPDHLRLRDGKRARRMARVGLGYRTLNVALPFFDAPFFGELT